MCLNKTHEAIEIILSNVKKIKTIHGKPRKVLSQKGGHNVRAQK